MNVSNMMYYRLSVTIPTFNRSGMLQRCLNSLIPQVSNIDGVEIIIVDNASTDNTEEIVGGYIKKCPLIKYYRNDTNLGIEGNVARCIEYARGQYCALLSDDDYYAEGTIQEILNVISAKEYALININYFAINKPYMMFASEKDVTFSSGYDILNYPSVGHISGFVYNSRLAKETLKYILLEKSQGTRDYPGVMYLEVPMRMTKSSLLPTHFIGKKLVGVTQLASVHYRPLDMHLDCYRMYYGLFKEGVLSRADLLKKDSIVLDMLRIAIITGIHEFSYKEIIAITKSCYYYFNKNMKFMLTVLPLLLLGRYKIIQNYYMVITKSWRLFKKMINPIS